MALKPISTSSKKVRSEKDKELMAANADLVSKLPSPLDPAVIHEQLQRMLKHNVGRKPLYRPGEHDQLLIDHMGQGFSYESFSAILGVTRQTLDEWAAKYPTFAAAKKEGKSRRLLYFEHMGLAGMTMGKQFNAIVWLLWMKNAFGWVDLRSEHKTTSDGRITIEVRKEGAVEDDAAGRRAIDISPGAQDGD